VRSPRTPRVYTRKRLVKARPERSKARDMSRAAQLVRDPSRGSPQIRVRLTLTFKSPPPSPIPNLTVVPLPSPVPSAGGAGDAVEPRS